MGKMQNKLFSVSGLIILGVVFIALIMLSNALLRGLRVDLTENSLYTVSDGTRNVLRKIDEPITLYFFYSDKAAQNVAALRPYAVRVQEMLEEFAETAGGKLRINVIDPVPFSEEEDQAAQFGLQALPTAGGESVYMGLAGTNAVGDEQIIPFFDPGKEAFLEYDLAKLVYALAHPDKPVVGLMTALPMGGDFNPQTRQSVPAWVIDEQIGDLFELRDLSPTVTAIDDDVDVLMLVHPKQLSDATLYAIDQYVLGGGKAMVFVDPHAEVDQPDVEPGNPAAAYAASRSSSLEKLFRMWGIEVPTQDVLGDDVYALQVGSRQGAAPTRHLALLGLDRDAIDNEDVVTADLSNINLGMPGYIRQLPGATTQFRPLLQSSEEAGTIPADRVKFLSDPSVLLDQFTPTGERYVLAARIQGPVASAFADGAPADGETEGHLSASTSDINVIVVADVDMLIDQFWVQVQNFFGQRIITPWAGNGDFVINALDNLTGSSDLIGIRSRATYRRPFSRVDELKRHADDRYRAKEQELTDQLAVTEDKLTQLQTGRNDDNPMIMTDEQSAEIERFMDQRTRIRKELRAVRRDLDREIESLGTRIKFINIFGVPILLSVAAIAFVWLRHRKRRSAAEASA